MEYYYRGVVSWEWYYPFHFSPPAADLVRLSDLQVSFRPGRPFAPFQQLLSVMPRTSAPLLPEPYRWMMSESHSPIIDFYPEDFEIDFEGKRADWEGVALICFIDEKRLLDAEAKHVPPQLLSAAERNRNREGVIYAFTYDENSTETDFCTTTCPTIFASVTTSRSRVRKLPRPGALAPQDVGFGPSLVPGTRVGVHAPYGFPTLFALPVETERVVGQINVFGTASKKESLIVRPRSISALLTSASLAQAQAAGELHTTIQPYIQPYNHTTIHTTIQPYNHTYIHTCTHHTLTQPPR
jgi:5'-3' exoribonuclease 1